MSGVRCQVLVSDVTCQMSDVIFFFLFSDKVVELVDEGLLSTGPTPSSFINSDCKKQRRHYFDSFSSKFHIWPLSDFRADALRFVTTELLEVGNLVFVSVRSFVFLRVRSKFPSSEFISGDVRLFVCLFESPPHPTIYGVRQTFPMSRSR